MRWSWGQKSGAFTIAPFIYTCTYQALPMPYLSRGGGGGGVAHSPFIITLNIAYSLNKSLNMATVPTCVILHLPGSVMLLLSLVHVSQGYPACPLPPPTSSTLSPIYLGHSPSILPWSHPNLLWPLPHLPCPIISWSLSFIHVPWPHPSC